MIEDALALQRIPLAPERAERVAETVRGTVEAAVRALLPLELEIDPTSHAVAMERLKE